MSKRTRKVGSSGRYGARYGLKIRKGLKAIEAERSTWYTCPRCRRPSLQRKGAGIWECRKCNHKIAGGAYKPETGIGRARAAALKKVTEGIA